MIRVALDYSGDEIAVAAVDETGRLLAERRAKVFGRSSAKLPAIVQDALSAADMDFSDVGEWIVGVGPGSFTALRVAAAFALGATHGTSIPVRGIPSACGLCGGLTEERALALYDGRKGELLAFGLRRADGFYVPDGFQGVLTKREELDPSRWDAFVVRDADCGAAHAFAPDCELHVAQGVDVATLARMPKELCNCKPTEPIYLRPAVFVDPRPLRTFGG